ncbi:MAG: TonB-dependent receptor, partial [Acidobacteriia bacterium]|nr:TonB-dependent receptor [Terriglobia bacterium]
GIGQFSLPSRAYASGTTEHNGQLTETAVVSAQAVNETRFQFAHTNTFQNGDNTVPTTLVASAFIGGGAEIGRSYTDIDHFELTNFTTVTHKTHTIRFGVRIRRDALTSASPENFGGTFSFFGVAAAPVLDANNQIVHSSPGVPELAPLDSIQQYQRTLLGESLGLSTQMIRNLGGGASQFSIASGNPLTSLSQFDASPFVQDDWRLRPNLTISLGMRYEVQTNIHDWRDFAPRLGVAWSPRVGSGRRRTVVRAGFGMFYDRVAETLTLQALRFNRVTEQQYVIQNPDFFPDVPSVATLASQSQLPSWYEMDHNLRAPYLLQSVVSVERQLPRNTTLAATFVNVHSLHLLQLVNINSPIPGTQEVTGGITVPGTGVRPLGASTGNLFLYESGGLFNQNMFVLTFNSRISRAFSLFGNYSLNHMNSNVDGVGSPPVPGSPSNPYDLNEDYGRSSLERRHRLQLVGSMGAPFGLRLSPFVILSSGAPYNLVIGQDLNGDTLPLDRPAFAADLTRKTVRQTPFGAFDADPIAGETIVPRNYLTGAALISLNLRVGRSFGFGSRSGSGAGGVGALGRLPAGARVGDGSLLGMLDGGGDHRFTLTVSVIGANIINHTNPGGYVGTLLSPLFGQPTLLNGGFGGGIGGGAFGSPANNRRLEFQTRLSF